MLSTTYKGKHVWWAVCNIDIIHDSITIDSLIVDSTSSYKPSITPDLYFPRLTFFKSVPLVWNATHERYITMQELFQLGNQR